MIHAAIKKRMKRMVKTTESPLNFDTRKENKSSNVFSFVMVSLYLNFILFQKDLLCFFFGIMLNDEVQK